MEKNAHSKGPHRSSAILFCNCFSRIRKMFITFSCIMRADLLSKAEIHKLSFALEIRIFTQAIFRDPLIPLLRVFTRILQIHPSFGIEMPL